jgi:phenolic acid decarboxylase
MKNVIIIIYKDINGRENRIDGVIKDYSHFPKWLKEHNENRQMNDLDYVEETEDDFELISVPFYKF